MAKVYINNKNDFESRLSAFMGICKKEGIIKSCLSRSYFVSQNEQARFKRLKHKKQNKKAKPYD